MLVTAGLSFLGTCSYLFIYISHIGPQDMVPITKEVSIPFDYHRFIIGKKGDGIRQLMTTHDVNIAIPPADQQSDTVTVVGTANCVESAVAALMEKVKELDDEQEDKVCARSAVCSLLLLTSSLSPFSLCPK